MPKNPKPVTSPPSSSRMYLTLSPECREALRRFSEVSGIAGASFAAQLLHDSIPMIEAITRAFDLAKSSPRQGAEELGVALEGAMILAAQGKLQIDAALKSPRLRKSPKP